MGHQGEQALNYAMKLISVAGVRFFVLLLYNCKTKKKTRLTKKGKRYLSKTVTVRIVISCYDKKLKTRCYADSTSPNTFCCNVVMA